MPGVNVQPKDLIILVYGHFENLRTYQGAIIIMMILAYYEL